MSSFFNTTRKASILAGAALCTAGWMAAAPAKAAEYIQVNMDEAKILRLAEPVARIIIGNPAMADVSVQNSTMLVLTGKSYGKTNMILLNRDGETILNARVSVDQDPTRTVSIRKGTERYSYHCTPGTYCNPTTEMGDADEQFDGPMKQALQKAVMAKGLTAKGGGGKPDNGGKPGGGE